jgi:hypothetical protein
MSAGDKRKVALGFTGSRENVLAALYGLGVLACGYSWGDTWVDRCDCKYGRFDAEKQRPGSEQTGCPELRSLYGVIEAMDDDEWYRLVMRAGGTPRGAVLDGDDIGQRLHRAEAAAAMAEANIAAVRAVLGGRS